MKLWERIYKTLRKNLHGFVRIYETSGKDLWVFVRIDETVWNSSEIISEKSIKSMKKKSIKKTSEMIPEKSIKFNEKSIKSIK